MRYVVKSIKKLVCTVLLASMSGVVTAETLVVATDVWEGYTNIDGTGYYTDIIKNIYEPLGIKVDVKYVTYERTVAMLKNNKADMILGSYIGEDVAGTFSKNATEMDAVDAAVSLELAKNWKGPESLEGKKVGAVRGMGFDAYSGIEMAYREVSNLQSLIKMLDRNRIDAILDYNAGLLAAHEATGLGEVFEVKSGVMVNAGYFVFANTPKGDKFRNIFDEQYPVLYKEGKLVDWYFKNTGFKEGLPDLNL